MDNNNRLKQTATSGCRLAGNGKGLVCAGNNERKMGDGEHASGCVAGFGGVESSKWVIGEGAGEKKRKKERESVIPLGLGLG